MKEGQLSLYTAYFMMVVFVLHTITFSIGWMIWDAGLVCFNLWVYMKVSPENEAQVRAFFKRMTTIEKD